MSVRAVTHLNFRGNARQALEFYQSVFGGDVAIVTYQDMSNVQDPSDADHVMWGQVDAESGFRIMAYDVQASKLWDPGENGFYVSLRGDSAEEITAYWEKLSAGATILQAFGPAPWGSPLYGMLKDQFGVTWVIDVIVQYDAS